MCVINYIIWSVIVVVQSLSCVQLFAHTWTAAHQAILLWLSPGVCSNSFPLSWWCHPAISSSATPFSFCLQSFPAWGSFHMKYPKYCGLNFSISPSNEYSRLISFQWIFKIDFLQGWLVCSLCSVKDSQESSLAPQFEDISSLVLSLLYGPTLISIHEYWRNYSFNYTALCRQSDVSLLFNMLSRFFFQGASIF